MDIETARGLIRGALPEGVWVGARKIDLTREWAVCVYRRKAEARRCIGGASGYDVLPLTVLTRGGIKPDEAEAFATEVFKAAMAIPVEGVYGGGYCESGQDCPDALGTDERGVYEYSFDIDIYIDRGNYDGLPGTQGSFEGGDGGEELGLGADGDSQGR